MRHEIFVDESRLASTTLIIVPENHICSTDTTIHLCFNTKARDWLENSHQSPILTQIERYSAATNGIGTMQTETQHWVGLISSEIILNSDRSRISRMIWRSLILMWPSSINGHVAHWACLLDSETQHMIFEMAPCDTPVILYISIWLRTWPDNWTMS